MNKFNLSPDSETDSYDSGPDHPILRNSYNRRTLPRYEFKIEISDLLAKFAEYSRLRTMLSCKYINHPITNSESDWETYESVNEDKYKIRKDESKNIWEMPIYLEGPLKNDASYARMVKKSHNPNAIRYKEQMWGQRYPNKRYLMNDCIKNCVQKIIHLILDRSAAEFLENSYVLEVDDELFKKIQLHLQTVSQNIEMNRFENFQQILNEFGRLFYSHRLMCMHYPHLLTKVSHIEIEFENQLEIHFGEWNTTK